MYTVRDLTHQCKTQGFSISSKSTLSRCIGDGVLQQIYYGEKDRIWIGVTSIYADLPEIFWQSKVPFTTFSAYNLHGVPSPRFKRDFRKENDIALLIDGGLSKLNRITTQEKLIQFHISTDIAEGRSCQSHNEWLWGAFVICGMKKELMNAVCYEYTQRSEGFRRNKTNLSLFENQKYDEYLSKFHLFYENMSGLSDLWLALLLNKDDYLEQYALDNKKRNLEQIRNSSIPMIT